MSVIIIINIRPQSISTFAITLGSMRHFVLLLLSILLAAAAMPANGQDAKYWLAQTASDYQNGSNSLALQDIDEYLDLNATDLWAWNFKANLQLKMNKYRDSVDSFDQIIKLNPSDAKAYNDRALILSGALRQDQEALDSLDQALQINPKSASSWYNKGMILEKQGSHDDALQAFGEATTLDPSLDKAWYQQGIVLAKSGRYNKSLQSLDQAIKINSKNADAWSAKGEVLMAQNSGQDALASFEKAISLEPSNKDFQEKKNEALTKLGQAPEKRLEFS